MTEQLELLIAFKADYAKLTKQVEDAFKNVKMPDISKVTGGAKGKKAVTQYQHL